MYSALIGALTGLTQEEYERYDAMSESERKAMAGQPVKRVVNANIAGQTVRVYEVSVNLLTLTMEGWKWWTQYWVNTEDIRNNCGASKTRFKHCLARAKNIVFDYEDEKRGRKIHSKNERLHNLKTKEAKGVHWFSAGHPRKVVEHLVGDLASRPVIVIAPFVEIGKGRTTIAIQLLFNKLNHLIHKYL